MRVTCPDCGGSGGTMGLDEFDRPELAPCLECSGTGEVESDPVASFVDGVMGRFTKPHCFLAMLPSDDEGYNVEVEVSDSEIAGMFNASTLGKAEEAASGIADELTNRGIKVFRERDNWEDHLSDTN